MTRAARRRTALLALLPLLLAAAPDRRPPELSISLNGIPDDEKSLLVVPPDHFRITLTYRDAEGPVDLTSLSVRSSQAIGALPAGTELASHFQSTPDGAVWEIPPGSDLARTSHYLTASIRDAAGNETTQRFGFAVRDFDYGPPLAKLQIVYLNFDRNHDGQQDFKASLRELGLSSASAPEVEQEIVDRLQVDVVERVHAIYGRNPDGTPGPDPVNVLFSWFDPQMPHTALCIGGEHPRAKDTLGAAPLDLDNIEEAQDLCAVSDYGVFPSALGDLWSKDPLFIEAFGPLLPALGGTPIGENPLDAVILSPDLDPKQVTREQLGRYAQIAYALDAFARVVAVAAAHEVGHTLGLSAPGPAPAGLFGGSSGTARDHDVTASGAPPSENYLMNFGGSFSFAEITGRKGLPKPFFRPISWAYLTNRLVRNERVTSLEPAPRLISVTPNPIRFGAERTRELTLRGENLAHAEIVDLKGDAPRPVPVVDLKVVDDHTVTGRIHLLFAPPGSYDVRLTTQDQQNAQLAGGVTIQR
jgi:hypothetical protein